MPESFLLSFIFGSNAEMKLNLSIFQVTLIIGFSILLIISSYLIRHQRGTGELYSHAMMPLNSEQINLIDSKYYKIEAPQDFLIEASKGAKIILLEDGDEFSTNLDISTQRSLYIGAHHFLKDDHLYFTSSDGSDPRVNERVYLAKLPLQIPTIFARALYGATILFAFFACIVVVCIFQDIGKNYGIFRRVTVYVLASCSLYLGCAFLYQPAFPKASPDISGNTADRIAHYVKFSNKYNLFFLGDSRTFVGMHPDIIDSLLGTESINLSSFSNWFPTQYAIALEIIDTIPEKATVVWSLGHQNFNPGDIQRVYPLQAETIKVLLDLGFSPFEVLDNFFWSIGLMHLYLDRAIIRDRIIDWSISIFTGKGFDAWGYSSRAPGHSIEENSIEVLKNIDILQQKYSLMPGVKRVDVITDEGRINSVVLIRSDGTYYRKELDPSYFRAKQMKMLQEKLNDQTKHDITSLWKPNPRYWRLFEAMLLLFKEHKINLVVNEMEDAPFIYKTEEELRFYRSFMREQVQPLVEKYGYPYIRVDFDELDDADYFDYNHLNSRGVEKYTPMLVQKLQKHIIDNNNHSDKIEQVN